MYYTDQNQRAPCHPVGERSAASTSQRGRFETELLATDANLEALRDMNGAFRTPPSHQNGRRRVVGQNDSSKNDAIIYGCDYI